jgi:probable rRNA maturation factor
VNIVDVAIRGVRAPRLRVGLAALCRRALAAAAIDGWDLSVLLTDDAEIRGLNARYRGKDRATDVLSFPQLEPLARGRRPVGAGHGRAAGDIVISIETLRRNAAERGIDEREELSRLAVHGILHLDGMDHGRGRGRAMLERQRRVLARLAGGGAS